MKTLLILRHAKSSWKDEDLPDHDRPLNERGKRDAPRMGKLIREQDLIPDLVLSSTATRARKTAARVAEQWTVPRSIELEAALYAATPTAIVAVLRRVDNDHDRVLLVGHNPGLEDLLALLTGHEEHLPTAALAQVELPISSWHDLDLTTRGRLLQLWHPRELEF